MMQDMFLVNTCVGLWSLKSKQLSLTVLVFEWKYLSWLLFNFFASPLKTMQCNVTLLLLDGNHVVYITTFLLLVQN